MFNSLKRSVCAWDQIDASQCVLSWITNGVPIVFGAKDPEPCFVPNPHFPKKEIEFVDKEIHDLVAYGVIKRFETGTVPHCISPIKYVPKRNGKLRMVVDLRYVNNYIDVPKFSLMTL